MKAETKFNYKKKSKVYARLAWTTIVIFVLAFVSSMLFSKLMSYKLIITIFLSALVIIIVGLVFNIISDMYRRRLVEYMHNIREYRIRKEYCRALLSLKSKDIKTAVNIYNKHIPDKHKYKDLLYISLIHEFMHSDDNDISDKGNIKYTALIADNNPNSIYLFE